MAFDFKKLLPAAIRTLIYGDIVSVTKTIIDDIEREHIERIKLKNDIETINENEIKDLAKKFGFKLTSLDGYTSTEPYLKREIDTIVKRITNKTTINAYRYIFYVFNIIGDLYLFQLAEGSELIPWLNWFSYEETEQDILFLDADEDIVYYYQVSDTLKFDSGAKADVDKFDTKTIVPYPNPPISIGTPLLYLDGVDDEAWTLDSEDIAGSLIRHILLSFEPIFIENETEFLSDNTLLALYNDVNQAKRKIEIPHFEFRIKIDANLDNTEKIVTYTDEKNLITATKNSILIGTDLSTITKIKYGNGQHSVLNASITDLVNPLVTVNNTEMNKIEHLANDYTYREKIFQNTKFIYAITELGLFDASNNCILYAKFPTIQFHDKMFSSLYVSIILS